MRKSIMIGSDRDLRSWLFEAEEAPAAGAAPAGAAPAGAAPASNNQFLKSRSDPITIDFLILVSFLYVRKHALQDIYLHVV